VWYGREDRLLPLAQPFFDLALAQGYPLELTLAEGAHHGDFNDHADYFEPAMQAMGAFIQKLGYLR